MDLMKLVATLSLDAKNFEQGIQQAKGQVGGLSSASVAVGNLMSQGFNAAVGAVKNFSGYVLDSGKSFESTMSEVQAISGASGQDLVDLTNKAKEMGATTKFSATEAGEAFTYMAMAGWDSGQMMDGITGIMNLAAASGENLANTSDIVTDALTAFGLKAEDAGHFSDVIAAASSNANTNVSMLGESFKYVAPLAGSMKYSAEDVAVALGIMANSGIKGSQAGTTLRSILTKLIKPTKDVEAAMAEYGLSLSDSSGNALPLDNVLGQLRTTFSNLSQAEQTQLAATLAGQEGMSGLLAIVNTSQEDFDNLKNSIYDCEGATQRMADVMQNNLGGSLTILKSGVEGLALTFFDGIKGTAKDAVDGLTEAVGKANEKVGTWLKSDATQEKLSGIADKIQVVIDKLLNNLDPILDGVIGLFEGLVEVIGFVIDNFDQIAFVVGTVITAFTAFKTVMGAIKIINFVTSLAPLISHFMEIARVVGMCIKVMMSMTTVSAPLIAGIVGIVAAIALLIKHADEVKTVLANAFIVAWESIKAVWSTVTGFFGAIWETIKGIFAVVGAVLSGDFSGAWDAIKRIVGTWVGYFQSIWKSIQNVFSAVGNFFKSVFSLAWNLVKDVWNGVTGFFKAIVTGIKNVFNAIPDSIKGFFSKAWEGVKGIWQSVTGWFSSIVSSVINAFTSIPGRISDFLKNAWSAIQNVWNAVTGWFSSIVSNVINAFTNIPSKIGSFFSEALNKVKSVWNVVASWFSSIVSSVVNAFTGIPSKISSFFSNAWNSVKNAWNSATSWFKSIGTNIINAFTSIPSRIASFFSNAWNNVKNAWSNVTSFFSGIPNKIYSIFTSLPSRFSSIGKDIVQGLWNGINNMVGWITGKIRGFTDSVVGSFKNFFGIKSPSRVMRDEVGKYLGMGVGEGIMDEADYVQKSFDSLMPDFGSLGTVGGFGASGGEGGNSTYSITINVNGGQYNDERSLAEAISNELQYMLERRKAVFA